MYDNRHLSLLCSTPPFFVGAVFAYATDREVRAFCFTDWASDHFLACLFQYVDDVH